MTQLAIVIPSGEVKRWELKVYVVIPLWEKLWYLRDEHFFLWPPL
jgi:hypothetical protein